ncbi:MAG: hypothetical protein IPK26_10020 [Planctomycetes bacterium]|nr:hypothetical protein [Planctomycetota bacterium]
MRCPIAFVPLLLLAAACQPLTYDLAAVPTSISARPPSAGEGPGEAFTLTAKNVLWVHGLFGHAQPDVAGLVAGVAQGSGGIADFRVVQAGSFHDWFLTHLTLGLMRMKTVTITGTRLPARAGGS